MPSFEFQWWMIPVVILIVVLAIVFRLINNYLNQNPNIAFTLRLVLGSIMIFVALGMLAGMTPPGTYEVCTRDSSKCIPYIVKGIFTLNNNR